MNYYMKNAQINHSQDWCLVQSKMCSCACCRVKNKHLEGRGLCSLSNFSARQAIHPIYILYTLYLRIKGEEERYIHILCVYTRWVGKKSQTKHISEALRASK